MSKKGTEFDAFKELTKKILSVPKEDVKKAEEAEREAKKTAKKPPPKK